jgi:mannose-6-phosphate isomerase-like protein (cupin superfamily)
VTERFDRRGLPAQPDAVAPDGSHVRILGRLGRGSAAHFALAPGTTSIAVVHRRVDEIWYFLSGRGEMWRRNAAQEAIVPVGPDVCITIPAGTSFQFRALGNEPLTAFGVTMPPWPDEGDAAPVEGPWAPSMPRPRGAAASETPHP